MKKLIIRYGLLGGAIVGGIMLAAALYFYYSSRNYDTGYLLGYTSMLLAFSLIFVAVKSYRDKENGGVINFGKAFKMGIMITLITSSIYVLAWLFVITRCFLTLWNNTRPVCLSRRKLMVQVHKNLLRQLQICNNI